MKKVTLIALFVLIPVMVNAQVLTLNSPETLAVPTSDKLFLKQVQIDVQGQTIRVMYQFLDAENKPIPVPGTAETNRFWYCPNISAIPAFDVLTCTGVDAPNPCCTGVGTGEGCYEGEPAVTCFTDTFNFAIRSQDVGTQIGKGLRALIWNKMRPSVLTGTNNATLP